MLLLSTLLSCNSVRKTYVTNNNLCQYDDSIFKIHENELKLNDSILKQLKSKKDITLVDNNFYKNRFYTLESTQITNKQTNKRLNVGKWIRYWPNGSIRWVFNLYLNGSKKIFKETQYDKNGKITQVINYEKGYNICYAEAIAIVKKVAKRKIKKYQITEFNLSHNNLNKFPNVKPEWQITFTKNNESISNPIKVYKIDGVTGKFLGTYKIYITP